MVHIALVKKVILALLFPFIHQDALLEFTVNYFFVLFMGVRKIPIVVLYVHFSGPGNPFVV